MLDDLANRMEANPALRLQVLAYASGGSGSAARSTSLNRAIAVRSYLMDRDIRRTRIDVRALGDTASDGSPDRIDLVIDLVVAPVSKPDLRRHIEQDAVRAF